MRNLLIAIGLCALFAAPAFAAEDITVYKPDGTLQCGQGDEISLRDMAKDLRRAGVGVLTSTKGHDGRFRTTMCGASTGNINIFEIRVDDYSKATELGFRQLSDGER